MDRVSPSSCSSLLTQSADTSAGASSKAAFQRPRIARVKDKPECKFLFSEQREKIQSILVSIYGIRKSKATKKRLAKEEAFQKRGRDDLVIAWLSLRCRVSSLRQSQVQGSGIS